MGAARVYFSTVPRDFKYISDAQLPTTSHNLLKEDHSLLFGKRHALKCFCFLAGRRLSAALPGLSGAVVCLRLGRLSGVAAGYLGLGGAIV